MSEDQGTHKSKKPWGWIQLASVIILITGTFVLSRFLSSLHMAPETRTAAGKLEMVVESVEVKPQSHRLSFSTTGTVQVRALTDIVPRVSGRIVAIDNNAFAGGMFTSDTLLFRIDAKDYELAIEQAQSEVIRAQTQLRLQKAQSAAAAAEWRELNPGKPIPPLVGQEPQLKAARFAVNAARSRLKKARLDLSRTEYRLPFTGRIVKLNVEAGQYVVAGQSYGQAYQPAALEVVVPLEAQQLAWLLESQEPDISVSSRYLGSASTSAFLKRVGANLDPQTRMTRVFLGFKEPNTDLVPDVFVSVEITGPVRKNVWLLPLDALQQDGRIWIVTPENRLRLLKLSIIQVTREAVVARSDGSTIAVVRGSLPEATEGTAVRTSRNTENGEKNHDRQK